MNAMGNAAYRREHYRRNKESYKAKAKAWTAAANIENRRKVREYLSIHSCVDCGEPDVVVLEFDHVRGEKRNSISVMMSRGCTWATIEDEIAKCEVRCANCHRRITHKRRMANPATKTPVDTPPAPSRRIDTSLFDGA